MSFVTSTLGSIIGKFLPNRAYWAVKLSTGKWCCELDQRFEAKSGLMRPFDWTLDLVDTGDSDKVQEVWLFCPPTKTNPFGSTARLPITEPGTAFQFKVGCINAFGSWEKSLQSQIIGRVDKKEEGTCTYFVWDAPLQSMSTPLHSSIYCFGSWREGIAPLGAISQEVMGLRSV